MCDNRCFIIIVEWYTVQKLLNEIYIEDEIHRIIQNYSSRLDVYKNSLITNVLDRKTNRRL